MKIAYKIIRSIIVTGIVAFVAIYVVLYLFLSFPAVQNKVRQIGEKELSSLLHAQVSIGAISISPFNQVVAYDVFVPDQKGDTILSVKKLGAGMSLYNLILKQKLVFTYAEIIGLDGRISKATPDSKTNIQFIIDALSKKDDNKPSGRFDVKIYNIVLRKSSLRFDVMSELRESGKFDKNHIHIENLTADISVPMLKNEDFNIKLKRLSLREKSGFDLKGLTAEVVINDKCIDINNFKLELPQSAISPDRIVINYNSLKTLGQELPSIPLNIDIPNSYITPSDIRAFVPALANFDDPCQLTLALRGSLNNLIIPVLNLSTKRERVSIDINGSIKNLDKVSEIEVNMPHIEVTANAADIAEITEKMAKITPLAHNIITSCGHVKFDGSIKGNLSKAKFIGSIYTSLGRLNLNGDFIQDKETDTRQFSGKVSTDGFKMGKLFNKEDLINETAFDILLNASKRKKEMMAKVDGRIKYIDFKGYRYSDVVANVEVNKSSCQGIVSINDENINININGLALLAGKDSKVDLVVEANRINLANLNLYNKYPDNNLSFKLDASFVGDNIDNADGSLSISSISFIDNLGKGIEFKEFLVEAHNNTMPQTIKITSDILEGTVSGMYDFKCLVPTLKESVSHFFPTLIANDKTHKHDIKGARNNFNFNFTILKNTQLSDFFNTPVSIIHPIMLNGDIDEEKRRYTLNIDAPYIQQKNKLIEHSSVNVIIDEFAELCDVSVRTLLPSGKGNVSLLLNAGGAGDRLDTHISWNVARDRDFHGNVSLSTLVRRDEGNKLAALIDINPSQLVFNDTVWNVKPAKVDLIQSKIKIENFDVNCDAQFVKMNGVISRNSEDVLNLDLNDINLNYVFETLEISNVTFGGRGTGKFYASDLFTSAPKLSTPNLHVEGFAYNKATLGVADIQSYWNVATKGIAIKAAIKQPNGYTTNVDGEIYPIADSIEMNFDAKHLDVQFLKPFLSNITSDIHGNASGLVTLFGSLKNVDIKGDVYADSVSFKVDHTNAYYTVVDSIKLRPGKILFENITVKDKFGNTANVNGRVIHEYFREASFDFAITNARNLLCLDITPKMNSTWYGTIFGNGSAFITGDPGVINIDVNMITAANSKFNFVLNDSRAASDYKFITIVDRNKKDDVAKSDSIPDFVHQFYKKKEEQAGTPSRTNINIQVETNPLAQLNLIMDPVGGDRIKATGNGNLRLTYNSVDDEIKMFGKYTLEKGNYNFTLQDIIIKDFTIKEGSSISFQGDPLRANLSIDAIYAVNANLTDLDESFAQDKDMNRTNVPVHALLNVKGDITQPTLSFDLELPTLTQDAYRKVKSIISTDDMMNRQIIYLLALSRFYTPEYMGNKSRNNELASVASSTISSQLSSMLGQLSENWSISPNFRTQTGDFSDVEVELALSSQLLNNRLLFNGNFGYRDNKLNSSNSNFIGDFDIEYLLTKSGTLRLKAYNHYNDQNYYIKSALTTQGVGILVKHDFEHIFDFLNRKPKPQFIKPENPRIDTTKVDTMRLPIPKK